MDSSSFIEKKIDPFTGANLIHQERQRQVDVLGWSATTDDTYDSNQLLDAASTYITSAQYGKAEALRSEQWPWKNEYPFNPSTSIRDLVKAGALIAAEIDRRLRLGHKIE